MKEIIAEREKRIFLFITVVGVISTIGCIFGLIYMPSFSWIDFSWLYIFGIVVMGLLALVGGVSLCFPKWVIIREEDNIVVHNGFRGFKKIAYKLADIVAVKVQQSAQKGNTKIGNIVLTVKVDGETPSTKEVVVINIKNKTEAVEKLNSLIQRSN